METGLSFSFRLVWLPQIRFSQPWLQRERLNRRGFTSHNVGGVAHAFQCYTKAGNVLARCNGSYPTLQL